MGKKKLTIVKRIEGSDNIVKHGLGVNHALSIRALKIIGEALMTMQAAASMSLVAFFLFNASDVRRREIHDEWR